MVATHRWSIVVSVVLFVTLLAGPAVAVPDSGPLASDGNETAANESSAHPRVNGDLWDDTRASETDGPSISARGEGGERVVTATVVARSGRADAAANAIGAAGGRLDSRYEDELQVELPVTALSRVANDSAVRVIRPPTPVEPTSVEGLPAMRAERVHDLGYDGTNATIAVVDTGGYDLDNPAFGDQVVETRDFSGNGIEGGAGSHGTKTAELAARTAPGADVVLVRIGTATDLKRAIDWLGSGTDTDVVSMSLAWANTAGPLDGTDDIDRAIGEFVADGGVWLTSSGNYANGRHWNGSWQDADGDGVLDVDGGESIAVDPPASGSADLFVSWDDWDTRDEDYDVVLVDGDGTVLDRSTNTQDGSTFGSWERVTVDATDGNPRLRIVHRAGAKDAQFNAFTFGSAQFDPRDARQSLLIPAASPDVISVGAVDHDTRRLKGYSSQGPTVDGRLKPDVVAPDGVSTDAGCCFYGTSAAAPHAAGVAALALSANGTLSPDALRTVLRGTTTPVREDEPVPATGWGLVNATGVVAGVERTAPTVENATLSPPTDDWLGVGDEVGVRATVTDTFGVERVRTNTSVLGGEIVSLTDGDGDGTYEGTVTTGANATAGTASLTVTATDTAGNTGANATGEIRVDAVAPTATELSLTDAADGDGVVVDSDTVAIAATVADDHAGVATVSANASAFGAGTVTLSDEDTDGTYDATVTVDGNDATTDGDYAVAVTSTDAAGNDGTATTGTLSLDTPPGIADYTATNPDGRTVELGLNATESLSSITASVDGPESTTLTESNFTVTAGRYVATWTPDADGEYAVTLDAAVDGSGNDGANGESASVLVDTTPPDVASLTLSDATDGDGTVGDGDTLSITATVADDHAGVATVSANASAFGAGTVTLSDGDTDGTYDATVAVDGSNATTDGDYGVEIAATDAVGNRRTGTTTALGLDTPPRIANVTVTNPSDRRVAVGFDASEPLSEITATIDGPESTTIAASDFSVTDGRYTAVWTPDADGEYTATLDAAVDRSGNDGADGESGTVTVDTAAPELTATRLDGGPVADGTRFTVVATVSDATAGVDTVRVNASAFGAGTVPLSDIDRDGTYRAALTADAATAAADGSHAVAITATDAAGNEVTETTDTVALDTAPPSLSVAAQPRDGDGPLGDGDRVEIVATATDATTGVATVRADATALGAEVVTLTDDDGDGTATATVAVGTERRASDGEYAIPVTATDDVGNAARASTDPLAVDTPPAVDSFALSALSGQRVAVSVQSSEPLAHLRVRLDGTASTTLDAADFERSGAGPYTYRAVRDVGTDGEVRATVTNATDDTGHDGATGQSETVSIDPVERRGGGGSSGGGSSSGGGGSSSGGSSSGGGGSAGGSSGGSGPAPPSADVTVLPTSSASRQATVARANPGEAVTVPFGVTDSSEQFGLTELSLTAAASDYELEVAATTDTPDDTPALDAPVGFLTISHTVSDANISAARFRFDVDAATLSRRGTGPGSVTLLRQTGDAWSARPTSHLGETNGTHRFEATAPGLSVFAVATDAAANLTVTNATLNRSTAMRADPVGVTVTVDNDGPVTGTRQLAVTANGTAVANGTVTVPGGEERPTTLPVEFARTGTYALAVDGRTAGTVTVRLPVDTHGPTAVETSTPSEPDTAITDGGGVGNTVDEQTASTTADGPGFSAGTALVAVGVAVLVLARRRL